MFCCCTVTQSCLTLCNLMDGTQHAELIFDDPKSPRWPEGGTQNLWEEQTGRGAHVGLGKGFPNKSTPTNAFISSL